MKLIDLLQPDWQSLELLEKELFQRAAQTYEQSNMENDAALCWAKAGNLDKAANLYLKLTDVIRAAPMFLSKKRYSKALQCYKKWLDAILETDVLGQVTARLGISACLILMKKKEKKAKEMYRTARALIEKQENQHPITAGLCWKALGDYGFHIGRIDLVQIGFERAISCYGDQYKKERMQILKSYQDAAKQNHYLYNEIKERLEELI